MTRDESTRELRALGSPVSDAYLRSLDDEDLEGVLENMRLLRRTSNPDAPSIKDEGLMRDLLKEAGTYWPLMSFEDWSLKRLRTLVEAERVRRIKAQKASMAKKTHRARVRIGGKQVCIGTYRTKEEADEAVFRFRIGITP